MSTETYDINNAPMPWHQRFACIRKCDGSNLVAFDGMWRKTLTLLVLVIAIPVTLVVGDVAYAYARSVWTEFASASVFNHGFCMAVVRHARSWNLLEGISPCTRYA